VTEKDRIKGQAIGDTIPNGDPNPHHACGLQAPSTDGQDDCIKASKD
jgi:hypothetical protein